MGNVLLDESKKEDPIDVYERWLEENPDLIGREVLTDNKLFRTSNFKYSGKNIKLKVFFKRDNTDLRDYLKSFQIMLNLVQKHRCVHILPMRLIQIKEAKDKEQQRLQNNIIMACRQFFEHTLEERLSLRPILNEEEKKWLIFQMIYSVYTIHQIFHLYHGNIRTSNFLLTTYQYLILTDFAHYKPNYILQDTEQGLAEFRLFYSSSIEKCNIAPEKMAGKDIFSTLGLNSKTLFSRYLDDLSLSDSRENTRFSLTLQSNPLNSIFNDSSTHTERYSEKSSESTQPSMKKYQSQMMKEKPSNKDLTEEQLQYITQIQNLKQMDVYSLGLSIVEVLNDGKASMNYEELLLRMKKETLENDIKDKIDQALSKISNSKDTFKELLVNMLKNKPSERYNIVNVLDKYLTIVNPDLYSIVWLCLSAFNKTSFSSPDLRICLIHSIIQFIENHIKFTGYKFVMRRPKSLEKLKPLKIFVEMIQKKIIFAPQYDSESIVGKMIKFINNKYSGESYISNEGSSVVESQLDIQENSIMKMSQLNNQSDQDQISLENSQRQLFFIHNLKQKKLIKKSSTMNETLNSINNKINKDKCLCPPKYDTSISLLIENKYKSAKLTVAQRQSNRFQQLLQQCKKNQSLREQKVSDKSKNKFYTNSLLFIKMIFSCIRSCKYISSKMVAMEMMFLISKECPSEQVLKNILPFLISLTQDQDINVCKFALNTLIDIFYNIIDPFSSEEDMHYFDIILEFFVNNIRLNKIRLFIFQRFKEIYHICQWLDIHFRKFAKEKSLEETNTNGSSRGKETDSSNKKVSLLKLIQILKMSYGSYNKQQIQQLLENVPECILPEMFQFYISAINTNKLEGLKYSTIIAKNITMDSHKHILDAFDNCVESGLDQMGIGLFYSIQYFKIRKHTQHSIVKKIAPHVINPSKRIRDEAMGYIKMCLEEYPPTKNYFLFKDVFEAPFPLNVKDLQNQILLPFPLKESQLDQKQKKFHKIQRSIGITEIHFLQYLQNAKIPKINKRSQQEVQKWNSQTKNFRENGKQSKEILIFKNYIKKQIQTLYEYNFFYYVIMTKNRYNPTDKEGLNRQILPELKKYGVLERSIDYQKKQLFVQLLGIVNSSFERLLTKNLITLHDDKLRLSEAISIIGEVICRFQAFKIKPIFKLGNYDKIPTFYDKLPRPQGLLISEIYEHKESINTLQKVADTFFVTGSSDGTLRIFDSKKIQTNITTTSTACLQIKNEGSQEKVKITSVSTFERTYTAVVGTNKGQIRIYPIERLSSNSNHNSNGINKANNNGISRKNSLSKSDQLIKYTVNGEIQKVITIANELQNECFCYITSQGVLGIQDIRIKTKTIICNVGKERGIPKCIAPTQKQSLLVGTIDGYLITYDIRCNIISNVLQLCNEKQPLPITNIYACPLGVDQKDQLFAITYPAKNYQFCYFNIYSDKPNFAPQKQFTSANPQQIINTPYFTNRTNEEQFKLCNNNLLERRVYDQLSDFHKHFNLFSYLSDPLTRKEAKIRQIWMDGCENRYNQISSLYTKKCLPFLEYLSSGILTNLNPSANNPLDKKNKTSLSLLIQKKQNRQYSEIDRILNQKPNTHKTYTFAEEENKDYYTCCKVLPQFVVVGCRNHVVKIFK